MNSFGDEGLGLTLLLRVKCSTFHYPGLELGRKDPSAQGYIELVSSPSSEEFQILEDQLKTPGNLEGAYNSGRQEKGGRE